MSSLLRVDLDGLRAAGENTGQLIAGAVIATAVARAPELYLGAIEALFDKEAQADLQNRAAIVKILTQAKRPDVYAVRIRYAVAGTAERATARSAFQFDLPDYRDALAAVGKRRCDSRCRRCRIGVGSAGGSVCFDSRADFRRRSSRRSIRSMWRITTTIAVLIEAARSSKRPARNRIKAWAVLATKVKTIHSWDDLVLPRLDLAASERDYCGDSTSPCGVFRVGI